MLRTGWLVVRLMILVSPSDQRGRVRSGAQRQMAVRSFSGREPVVDRDPC
jgi:hypothetical protein